MKTKFLALTIAATTTLAAIAPTANAMTQGYDALANTIANELAALNISTENLSSLSTADLVAIKDILSDSEDQTQVQSIKLIVEG